MNIAEHLRQLGAVEALRTKASFVPAGSVSLRDFLDLEEASGWCEERWRRDKKPYFRRIWLDTELASFTFASKVDMVAFALRYG
jgi:hypothetical protein